MRDFLNFILLVNGVFLYAFIGFGLWILASKVFKFDWKKEWKSDAPLSFVLSLVWPLFLWVGLIILPFYLVYVVVNKIVEGMR